MPEPQQDLLEALTTVYKEVSTIRVVTGELDLLDALQSPDRQVSTIADTHLKTWGEKLHKIILKDSRFSGNSPRMIQGDSIDSKFYPDNIGNILVRRALQTGRPEEAIAWLQKVLGTTVAFGKTIQALWGVKVKGEIQLTQDVKIVPFEDVPDSEQKQLLTNVPFTHPMSPVMSVLPRMPPESALIIARRIEPFIFDPDIQSTSTDDVLKTRELLERLEEIALVLTVVGPRVAILAPQWLTYDDPDLQQASMMSGRGSRGRFREILPGWLNDYPVLDPIEAPQIVQYYLALHGDTRSKVRVALQRFNQALCRGNAGDRAVELSTALEALLGEKDVRIEMTHKIKVRSVRLIGGENKVRMKNAVIIKKAYDIRGDLVHTGHVDATKSYTICGESMSVSDIIDQAVLICANLIKIIIRRGSIPDWSIFDITEHQ